jgi:hypothetical protein
LTISSVISILPRRNEREIHILGGSAMSCSCQKHPDNHHHEEVFKLLEILDIREIGEQAAATPETTATATRYLQKAERAERLGFGADVAALYRQAAERKRARAIRQYRTVITRLDERIGRDDWGDLVERVQREFLEGDGPALVEEARGRLRLPCWTWMASPPTTPLWRLRSMMSRSTAYSQRA